MKGMDGKAIIIVDVHYCTLTQGGGMNEPFNRQVGEILESIARVLMGDLNFPDINWDYCDQRVWEIPKNMLKISYFYKLRVSQLGKVSCEIRCLRIGKAL